MKAGLVGLAVLGLAACQPAGVDQLEAPQAAAVGAPTETVVFPQPSGPVADYFIAELSVSAQGRWAADVAACAAENIIVLGPKTFSYGGVSGELGDIAVNASAGVILDMSGSGRFTAGGQSSDGRISMTLSVDGSRLRVFVTGMPARPDLRMEAQRCI